MNSHYLLSIILIVVGGLSLLGNPAINQTTALGSLNALHVSPKLASPEQTASSTSVATSTSSSSASSGQSTSSSLVTLPTTTSSTSVSSSTSASSTSTQVTTSSSTQTTTSSTTTSSTSVSQTTTTILNVPSILLNPSSGSTGSTVQVTGSDFSTIDTTCVISGAVVASQTCSVSDGTLTGAFTVANVAGGIYSVSASGTQAVDSASASFTVNAVPPSITLNPSSAQVGATVDVAGSDFSAADTSCSLSGSPVGTMSCSISSGTLSASFVVAGAALSGTYTVTATGSPGGDSASASLTVSGTSPSITLSSTSASVGATVDVTGSDFSTADTSCSLSGSPVGTLSCSISSGTLSASFTVVSIAAGTYTVTATGSPSGDYASATFVVSTSAISITFNPASAQAGSNVQVSGSGFSSSDTSCSLSGSSVASSSCTVSGGTLTGSFAVAAVAPGSYTVTVTGSPEGDLTSATLTVTSALSIAFNPTSAAVGTTVQVSGSSFSSSDSGCSLSGSVVSYPSCTISNGALTGSFIVTNVTAGSYTVTATGSPTGDYVSAAFSVSQTTAATTSSSTATLPDFSLTSTPSITLTQGGSGSATVTVRSINGFSSTVTLTASWVGTAPAGAYLFIGSPITPLPNETATAPLTVTVTPTASIGTFAVQVNATSGSLTQLLSTDISVQILQAINTTSSTSTTSSSTSTASPTTSSTSTTSASATPSAPAIPTNCPVSTATSGSALAPLAQGLRVFRDQSIMKTRTGVAFMTLFNAWYYSFSPPLASYLGTHQTQRELFGYTLYPLIGLLYASYYTYLIISPLNGEVAALTAGLVAAAIIGFVYLAPPLYFAKRILRRKTPLPSRLTLRLLFALPLASSAATGFSYLTGTGLALGFAAATLLLSILTLGVIAGILVLKRVKFTDLAQPVTALNEVFKTLTICTMKVLNSSAEE